MSKSSGNDDINIAYLDKLTEAVVNMSAQLEKISPNYGSNGQLEQTLRQLAKQVQSGDMTLKQMLKEGAATQKNIRSVEYGLEDTARYNRTVNMFIKILGEKIEDSKLDDVLIKKITTAFENLDVTAILESEKIGQRGGRGAPLKNVMDNEKLGKVNEDLAKRIGLKLDKTTDKLMEFFQEQEKKKEKKTAGFVNDLIEGLEKSKWVGGALHDTFRLIGLLGANWLSQFGELGRILGASFYVAMETFGPQLAKLLVEGVIRGTAGLSKALWGLVGSIGTLLGGVASKLIYKSGGPILDLMTAPTTVGKAAALGKVGGGLGAIAAGGWAISQGIDSWKQGRRGNAAALGIGGAGLIAGGAAVLAGVAAPITVPLIAISGAVAGIAVLWKHHSETIKKWAGKFGSFVNKVIDFMALWNPIFKAIQWIRDHWPGAGKGIFGKKDPLSSTVGIFGTGAKGASAHLLEGKTDKTGHLDIKKMSAADWKQADSLEAEYDPATGAIVNLGKMTQRRAAEVIKKDIQSKGDKSYYEIAEKSLVDKSQFKTDVADKDNVYLVRGTSARVKSDLDKLQSLGYDISKAKIMSGIGTLGSPEMMSLHSYADSPRGHFGTTSTVDVGYIYKDGRRANYSEYSRHLGKMVFGQSESDHDHWAYGLFQYQKEQEKAYTEAKKEEQKAIAEVHSINAGNVLKDVDEKAYEKAKKSADYWLYNDENKAFLYEQELKKRGVTLGTIGSSGIEAYSRVNNGEKEFAFGDKTGNISWLKTELAVMQIQQFGANGR